MDLRSPNEVRSNNRQKAVIAYILFIIYHFPEKVKINILLKSTGYLLHYANTSACQPSRGSRKRENDSRRAFSASIAGSDSATHEKKNIGQTCPMMLYGSLL